MEVINKIKIDLLKPGVKPMVNAMQADENSRVLEITLNANGSAWEIPTGVSFSVAYKKPDGTKGLYDTMPDGSSASSADGNVVSIRLAPQMLTAPGAVTASVIISAGDQRISTFPIIVNVIQNPAVGAVGSEDYFYSSVIGNLDDLKTTNKTNLVSAINEIFSTGGSNSGQNVALSTAQINALDGMFRVCAYDGNTDYDAAYEAFRVAFGLSDSGGEEEPDTPVEPDEPEVTLTSISAVYSGGDVPVGTAVADLTGIVVTAHYSDGTSKTVTGYTLSGSIAEGENTVTVSYQGKTAAFSVTGAAGSGGGESHEGVSNINWFLKNTTYGTDDQIPGWNENFAVEPDNGYLVKTTAADGLTAASVNTVCAAWPLQAGKTYAISIANGKNANSFFNLFSATLDGMPVRGEIATLNGTRVKAIATWTACTALGTKSYTYTAGNNEWLLIGPNESNALTITAEVTA